MNSPAVPLARVAERLREAGLLVETDAPEDVVLRGVSQDSRSVREGDLFLAWKGTSVDAHDFVADAARAGAAAAVVERRVEDADVPQLRVREGREGGAVAADEVLGSPWKEFFLAGITGTNGKTTTAVLTRHLLARRGPAAAVGTLGLIDGTGEVRPGTEELTTPGPVRLSGWLRELADAGVRAVTMEASSHALEQRRLDGIRFDVAVFTNLDEEHLDYHGSLDRYRAAKLRLLDLLTSGGAAVVNRDEEAWDDLPLGGRRVVGFGIEAETDVRAEEVRLEASGSRFLLEGEEVALPLPGRFNVENALAAAGTALLAGLSTPEIARGLASVPQIPGRLEVVVREPVQVLIDFAHTPGALRSVLATLRPLVRGRLIVVFGAGGDRDRSKRAEMARAVAAGADVAIATSDNPRSEDPERILDEVAAGFGESPHLRITDRAEAIRHALEHAGPDDLVLLAGKGHERWQEVRGEKRPFDERVVVRKVLDVAGGAP